MKPFSPNEAAVTPAACPETAGLAGIEGERVIAKEDNSVTLEFSVSGASPYFDGHFPGFPILPAVAQMELIVRYAARHLGTCPSVIDVSEIRRVKFSNLIRPSIPLVLKLEKKEKTVSFNLSSPDGETAYSSGSFEIRGRGL